MKATNAKSQSWRDGDEIAAEKNEKAPTSVGKPPRCDDHRPTGSLHFSILPKADSADLQGPSIKKPAQARKLSTRAENVLKILAVELTGEEPPRGRWVPSELLLQRLSYKHLAAARNCGPQTTAEIIEWAQGRGTDIRLSFPARKIVLRHVAARSCKMFDRRGLKGRDSRRARDLDSAQEHSNSRGAAEDTAAIHPVIERMTFANPQDDGSLCASST